MAALMGSSQPFQLRQICLNDLLNAEITSIVTSLAQPHGKMSEITCSNLLLESPHKPERSSKQPTNEVAIVQSELVKTSSKDEIRTSVSSSDRDIEDVDLGTIAQDFCQEDVEEMLKEQGRSDSFLDTITKPRAKRRKVVMSNPADAGTHNSVDLSCGDMQWLEPMGLDSQGNKVYGAAFRGAGTQDPLYICRSCCVILRAAESSDSFYIARATKLYERCSDGAKMVSCQWFFRKEDTVLAHRKGSANRVGKQELFESDSVDENSLHAIEDVCEVLAEPLLVDVQSWLSDPQKANLIDSERYYYGSKYLPNLKCFKALNNEDMVSARFSYAASSRAVEQTIALRMLGNLKRTTLLPAADGPIPSSVKVSIKLSNSASSAGGKFLLHNRAVLGSEWRAILSGEAYRLIASKVVSVSSRVGIPNSADFRPPSRISHCKKPTARCLSDVDSNTVNDCNGPASDNASRVVDSASTIHSSSKDISNADSIPLEVASFSEAHEAVYVKDPEESIVNPSSSISWLLTTDLDVNLCSEPTAECSSGALIDAVSKTEENSIVCIPPAESSGLSSPLLCSSPSNNNVSADPDLLAHKDAEYSYQTPPIHAARAFHHSAPRLQLAPSLASSQLRIRSSRKECERRNQGDFRSVRSSTKKGLEHDFSGSTASRAVSRKLNKFDAQHSSITWIGPGRRGSEGRTCFSAAILPSGEKVSLGSSVKLIAERKACFLARILEMWETERDGLKMMRCRWFCRPGETLMSNHSAAITVAEHPREVFLDESGCDENFMTTIGLPALIDYGMGAVSRTVILHKDHLPANFDLNLLQCGDCYFFARSYSRNARQLSPVPAPGFCSAVEEDIQTLLQIQAMHGMPDKASVEHELWGSGDEQLLHGRLDHGYEAEDTQDRRDGVLPMGLS